MKFSMVPATRTILPIAAGFLSMMVTLADIEEERPLNLFQRIARADLVVHVKVRDGAQRFALVDVLDPLKGTPPISRLRIAFRDFNFYRKPGTEPIIFPTGQEEILFLTHYPQARRKEKNRDLFELFLGSQGRITVPAEGSAALLEAVRRMAGVTTQDPATQIDSLIAMLGSDNPYLLEGSLDEVARLHIASPVHYGRLVGLLTSRSPSIRSRALRLLAGIFLGSDATTSSTPGADDAGAIDQGPIALQAVIERARNDSDEEVRVAAVLAIASWPDRTVVEGELRAIADRDPAQEVRYAAERALIRGRRSWNRLGGPLFQRAG